MRVKLTFFIFICSNIIQAQNFIHRNTGEKLTFIEIQRQFEAWKESKDLKNIKHWKYFKRWQNDMQFKTDGSGELADPAIFINEAVNFATHKNQKSTEKFSLTDWTPTGPFNLPDNLTGYMQNGIGRINCITFHPTDSATFFVGVAQGGVWKTTNNGLSWTPLTDQLPIERISDIAIDPSNTNIMYIAVCDFEYIDVALNIDGRKRNTHYGLGVYKTIDGGLTWNPTGLTFQLTDGDASLIRKVLINPSNSNKLLACGVNGMYASDDAGSTWSKNLDSLFWDLVQDPINPNTIYATTGWLAASNYGSAGVYKSLDFGATWTMLPCNIPATGSVQRLKIAIAPSDNNYIYIAAVDQNEGAYGIYKSTDAGNNWTFINSGINMLEGGDGSSPGGQGTYDLGFSINKTNQNIVYIGGVNIWASTDGALSFNPVSHWTLNYGATIHGDIHFIETNPLSNEIFVCSDGGLYKTTNVTPQSWIDANNGSPWPTNWSTISGGMNITSFYRLSSSRNSAGRLAAGAQDNATFYYDGTGWKTIFGGDGMDNYLDPINNNFVIGASQYGNFYISDNGGISSNGVNVNVNSENGEWVSPIIADYENPGTLYVGLTNVNKSIDGGYTWEALSPLPSNGIFNNEISSLACAKTNSNILYVTRRIRFEYNSPSSIYKTIDGGNTWTDITLGLPDSLYYTSSIVSSTDENTIYITLAGFEVNQKVYKSSNGGLTWENISFNLPNIPINCIKTIPTSNQLIIATDLGVYIFNELSSTWINVSNGLPNVIVSDIEFNEALDKIYIATFGRGIWENNLSSFIDGLVELENTNASIELFPTLNNGTFTIKLSDEKDIHEKFELEIVNINGQCIYTSLLQGQMLYTQSISIPAGMYFVKLKSSKIKAVKRIIIE